MPRTLVVHASHLLARGMLTAAPDATRTDEGEPTAALYALTRALRTGIGFKEPELAVAVLDETPPTEPPALVLQHERLEALLDAHGIDVVRSADARHVVASYTRAARALGHDVVIVGSDKRLAQLVGDDVWWYDAYKDVRYTPESVRKRFEVLPPKVSEWLALVGDDDGLPGIKGIGKKGASTLLASYGTIREALASVDEIKGRTGNALRAAGEEAVVAELERAHLRRDAPLPRPLAELPWRGLSETLGDRYAELGFVSLIGDEAPPLDVVVCTTADEARAALEAFDDRPLSLQVICEDPTAMRGALVGLAIAQTDGPACFVLPDALDGVKAALEDPERAKIGHDTKDAELALGRAGVALAGVVSDVACASHLHEPSNLAPQDLPILTRHFLKRALPDDDAARGVGRKRRRWGKLKVEKVAQHAAAYAEASAAVWEVLEPTTPRAQLDEYLALAETLVGMERRGIAVDAHDLRQTGADFQKKRATLEADIHELAGHEFNVNSTKQLGAVLFDELGLEVVSRTKTGWSTATWALERIADTHAIVPLVIHWRTLRRLEDTWVTALLAQIDDDARVRSSFSPSRSFSGRLVNANPDLGRVPGKTEEMARIRHAFAPPKGRVLLSVDYSQLGLYVLAHLTKDPALVEPLRSRDDMHTLTASAVLDLPVEEIDRDRRQLGKVVNFATFAGQGASALAQQLNVTAKEAQRYIARFDERYAVVRAFQEEQFRFAKDRGYLETIAGRRWPIGGLRSPDPQMLDYAERLARRATHEGSVADVSRRGLLRADQALRAAGLDAFPLLQVHDEVLFEASEADLPRAAEVAAEAMRTAYELEVPLRVGCKAGPNWAELTPLL